MRLGRKSAHGGRRRHRLRAAENPRAGGVQRYPYCEANFSYSHFVFANKVKINSGDFVMVIEFRVFCLGFKEVLIRFEVLLMQIITCGNPRPIGKSTFGLSL